MTELQETLLPLEEAYALLSKTEPLHSYSLSSGTSVKFKLEPDWALDIDAKSDNTTVPAFVTVGSTEHQFTRSGLFQAAANFGLPAAYIKRVPAHYIETLLNYHYGSGMGDTELKLLTVQGNATAFSRPTVVPYSNIALLDAVVDGACDVIGSDVEILADRKFNNTLTRTDIRLVIPELSRIITGGGMSDLENGQDVWHGGIHLSNSAIGKTQTTLDLYLFRQVCSNGATVQHPSVGVWSRRRDGDDTFDVYEWAQEATEDLLEGVQNRFDEVQALTALKTAGNTADILKQIFAEYAVPKTQQAIVGQNVLAQDTLSMYTIMNAITQAANDSTLDEDRVDKLLRIGGSIPTHTFDTIKALVWDEGHSADDTTPNPYKPQVV